MMPSSTIFIITAIGVTTLLSSESATLPVVEGVGQAFSYVVLFAFHYLSWSDNYFVKYHTGLLCGQG